MIDLTSLTADAAKMAPGQLNRYRGAFRSAGPAWRWVGRCRHCRASVKVEGEPVTDAKGDAAVVGADGLLYTTRTLNGHEAVLTGCGGCDRWVIVRKVRDGGKPDSRRHKCNAVCTNATGPNCDCRCRGENHGSGH